MTYKAGLGAAVAAALALVSGPTYAADFYAGASIGDATLETSDSIDGQDFDFEASDTAFKVFGGYMFNDYFGVEVAYYDGGDQDDRFGFDGGEFGRLTAGIEASLSGFSAQGVAQYPVGPVDLFAKVGVLAWDLEADLEIWDSQNDRIFSEDVGDDGADMIYGVGARYNFGQWGVRAEYEIIDAGDIDDANVWSVGVEYSFPL